MDQSWKRPKINIPKTASEKIWDIIGYCYFIGTIIFFISVWSILPDQVPGHYNGLGEVDRWGSKWELIMLPIISLFLLLMLQFLERHPEWHNYPSRFNESNAKAFYLLSRKMLNIEKNICILVLQTIHLESIMVALGRLNGLGVWFLPLAFVLVLLPIIVQIIKQRKIE
ncbi:DUF1648 domain-containing protein [Neobacillus niacini]|uniref:DUF1648 domain-containing protein n=1 Tax=Neobacillus niacini TaxID=86668 RepID=UPI0039838113